MADEEDENCREIEERRVDAVLARTKVRGGIEANSLPVVCKSCGGTGET